MMLVSVMMRESKILLLTGSRASFYRNITQGLGNAVVCAVVNDGMSSTDPSQRLRRGSLSLP